jgi:hypothetical protein
MDGPDDRVTKIRDLCCLINSSPSATALFCGKMQRCPLGGLSGYPVHSKMVKDEKRKKRIKRRAGYPAH